MARFCGVCKGSGWVGARTDFGHKPGGPCRACGGSGYDQRWGEKMCRGCSSMIEYRYDWSNVPEYCPNCKGDQYKTCANPHCGGTVRYKKFWDNIPDYCSTCKGWYELTCENSYCRGVNRIHASWTNVSKYCKTCKGWAEKDCRNGCGNKVKFRCDWSNIPDTCETCKKNRNNRSDQNSERDNMNRLIRSFPELRDRETANRFHRYLEQHYVRNIDKPTTYDELERAYYDWKS